YLMELFRPDEMEHRVQAIMPDGKTRDLLKMDELQPCLKLSRRTWKNNQVVTYATMLYPGDRYELTAKYLTNDYQITNH
ncbi:MAG: UTRA domain-containing protein, partial [Proteobacteria bacterium]|nr:UTRA domain-containing protein [Pseudomonadota bacterium]